MNNHAPQKNKPSGRTELVFAVMLFLFIAMAVTFLVLFAVNKLNPPAEPPDPSDSSVATTTTGNREEPILQPNPPLFANGTTPAYPVKTDGTVLLDTELSASNAIIIDAESGAVLAGKNTDATFTPASMTKVMTLVVACEKLTQEDLSKRLVLTEYYNNYDYNGMSTWLISGTTYIGDQITIEDLLYGVGMVSAAECVLMLADYTYGSMDAFVDAMNQKAQDLHLKGTYFGGASGDTPEGNTTTAEDMAVIMAYAMQNSLIREILSTTSKAVYSYSSDGSSMRRWLNSTFHKSADDSSRMNVYQEQTGTSFSLSTVKKEYFAKTGWLNDLTDPETQEKNYRCSTLVLSAVGKTTGKRYIVVINHMSGKSYQSMTVDTMKDAKYLFDTYAA